MSVRPDDHLVRSIALEQFRFVRSVRLQADRHGPAKAGHYVHRKNALAAALIALWIAAPAAQPPAPPAVPAGNAANGKTLYTKHTCFFCHGTAGQGGIAGARIAAVARNTQSFIRYVRRPSGQMPAYTEKILTDQELADIFAYVRDLPAAKKPAEIPLLNQLLPKPPL